MRSIRRILIAVKDYEVKTTPALVKGAQLARALGARIELFLKRLFIGNTAERVLDLLSCDILVVKPAHFTNRVPRGRQGVRVVAAPPVPLRPPAHRSSSTTMNPSSPPCGSSSSRSASHSHKCAVTAARPE